MPIRTSRLSETEDEAHTAPSSFDCDSVVPEMSASPGALGILPMSVPLALRAAARRVGGRARGALSCVEVRNGAPPSASVQ